VSEKKVVRRSVAIALGIGCIVLLVGLVGAVLIYTSMINEDNSTISSLNFQITDKDSQISSLNTSKTSLQNQINDLNNITNLEKSETWVNSQTVSSSGYWSYSTDMVFYAGYVSVWVQTSTSSTTTVRASWSSNGINYDNAINVGTSGKAVFPVLPTTVKIEIENSDLFTATITYYY